MVIIRDSDPDSWARVQLLMDHDEERRKELDYWKMFQVVLIIRLLKKNKNTKTIDNTEHKPIALNWYIKNYKKKLALHC